MAIIKKPVRKTLLLLISFVGVVSILIGRLFVWNSNTNLAQLENKAKKIFAASNFLIPIAKADIPYIGDGGGGGDCDDGDGCSDGGSY